MKHLFSLLLIIMCGTCAIEIIAVDSKEELTFAIAGMALSFTVLVLNIISPLFNTKS